MCQQTSFKHCKYITTEYIDYNLLIEFIQDLSELQLTSKYAKTVITQSKGCVKCFFTRLTKHIRNENELIALYCDDIYLRARETMCVLFFKYLLSKQIISSGECEKAINEYLVLLKK